MSKSGASVKLNRKKIEPTGNDEDQILLSGTTSTSGSFTFRRLSRPPNWDRMKALDIEKIIQKSDVATVLAAADDVCFGDVSQEDVDPDLFKAMSLAQFSVQYLMSCKNLLKSRQSVISTALKSFDSEEDLLDIEIAKLRSRKKALKRESRSLENVRSDYLELLIALDPKLATKYRKSIRAESLKLLNSSNDLKDDFIRPQQPSKTSRQHSWVGSGIGQRFDDDGQPIHSRQGRSFEDIPAASWKDPANTNTDNSESHKRPKSPSSRNSRNSRVGSSHSNDIDRIDIEDVDEDIEEDIEEGVFDMAHESRGLRRNTHSSSRRYHSTSHSATSDLSTDDAQSRTQRNFPLDETIGHASAHSSSHSQIKRPPRSSSDMSHRQTNTREDPRQRESANISEKVKSRQKSMPESVSNTNSEGDDSWNEELNTERPPVDTEAAVERALRGWNERRQGKTFDSVASNSGWGDTGTTWRGSAVGEGEPASTLRSSVALSSTGMSVDSLTDVKIAALDQRPDMSLMAGGVSAGGGNGRSAKEADGTMVVENFDNEVQGFDDSDFREVTSRGNGKFTRLASSVASSVQQSSSSSSAVEGASTAGGVVGGGAHIKAAVAKTVPKNRRSHGFNFDDESDDDTERGEQGDVATSARNSHRVVDETLGLEDVDDDMSLATSVASARDSAHNFEIPAFAASARGDGRASAGSHSFIDSATLMPSVVSASQSTSSAIPTAVTTAASACGSSSSIGMAFAGPSSDGDGGGGKGGRSWADEQPSRGLFSKHLQMQDHDDVFERSWSAGPAAAAAVGPGGSRQVSDGGPSDGGSVRRGDRERGGGGGPLGSLESSVDGFADLEASTEIDTSQTVFIDPFAEFDVGSMKQGIATNDRGRAGGMGIADANLRHPDLALDLDNSPNPAVRTDVINFLSRQQQPEETMGSTGRRPAFGATTTAAARGNFGSSGGGWNASDDDVLFGTARFPGSSGPLSARTGGDMPLGNPPGSGLLSYGSTADTIQYSEDWDNSSAGGSRRAGMGDVEDENSLSGSFQTVLAKQAEGVEKLSLSLLAIESDVPVTWKPGRAAMDLVETSRALDVFVSGIRLDSDVIDTVTEVVYIQLEFLGVMSAQSSAISTTNATVQPISFAAHLEAGAKLNTLVRKGIQEEGEYLSLHIHVLDHNSASIGMATINIRVMIDESCSVLRQEADIVSEDETLFGSAIVDVRGHRFLINIANF